MTFDEYLVRLTTFLRTVYTDVKTYKSSYGIHFDISSKGVVTFNISRLKSYLQAINDNSIDIDTSFEYIAETIEQEINKQRG